MASQQPVSWPLLSGVTTAVEAYNYSLGLQQDDRGDPILTDRSHPHFPTTWTHDDVILIWYGQELIGRFVHEP